MCIVDVKEIYERERRKLCLGRGYDIAGKISVFTPRKRKYRGVNKGLYVVARNFFLLLLNCSAWVLLSKTYKPLFTPLYMVRFVLLGLMNYPIQ